MKKFVTTATLLAFLVACSPQTPPVNETIAPQTSSDTTQSASDSAISGIDNSVPQTPDDSPSSAPSDTVSQPDTSSDAADEADVPETKVRSTISVTYSENDAYFSQTLTVPQDTSYQGDTDAISVERRTPNGAWERVRDDNTGKFTLEGKLTVKGALPHHVLDDALNGTPYRITTRLSSGNGPIVAQNTFLAGNTFGEESTPPVPASSQALTITTSLSSQDEHTVLYHRSIKNNSSQTILLDQELQIMEQNANGLWTSLSTGNDSPTKSSAAPLLLPGTSFTSESKLPLSAAALRRGKYRITHSATVATPTASQPEKFDFFVALNDTILSGEQTDKTETPAPFSTASIVLQQTSFVAGDATVVIYVKNMSSDPIVASKVRVYNVKDGQELYPGEETFPPLTIMAGEMLPVLEHLFALEPGEYAAEVTLREVNGTEQSVLSQNLTVESQSIQNPASAATVAMQVEIEPQPNGLAAFSQTFTNKSAQTLLVSRDFRVEVQTGGLWAQAEYPDGQKPDFPEDLIMLYPGDSVTLQGELPFTGKVIAESYRIARSMKVLNPLPGQKNGLTLVYTVTSKSK